MKIIQADRKNFCVRLFTFRGANFYFGIGRTTWRVSIARAEAPMMWSLAAGPFYFVRLGGMSWKPRG